MQTHEAWPHAQRGELVTGLAGLTQEEQCSNDTREHPLHACVCAAGPRAGELGRPEGEQGGGGGGGKGGKKADKERERLKRKRADKEAEDEEAAAELAAGGVAFLPLPWQDVSILKVRQRQSGRCN